MWVDLSAWERQFTTHAPFQQRALLPPPPRPGGSTAPPYRYDSPLAHLGTRVVGAVQIGALIGKGGTIINAMREEVSPIETPILNPFETLTEPF
jgi:hypothetical protein